MAGAASEPSLGAPLERALDVARAVFVRPGARRLPRWLTPNVLTAVRLALVVPVAFFLLQEAPAPALVFYLLAAATDALDGEVARLRGWQSRFGARFDPAVDKVLHGTVFLFFVPVEPLLLGLVIAADLLLFLVGSALALTARARGADVSASVYGKWKFVLQAVVVLVLFWNALRPAAPVPPAVLRLLLLLALAFAGCSLPGYARRFRP